ncbi:disabled homolog 2-like isoform X1 [Acipenser ruthenus]|uniref:disabled homolog 2-like isoform X1 n=1 Tax=Acipenser ruthenus TaxID=7906 RepID=UPI0027406B53|nr:disabled homolog 2-like isoform X1 [Acipenser ruthenus]XP_058871183.1 disabled homolog 2-like isoform X1 [Acipenser ruthenus]
MSAEQQQSPVLDGLCQTQLTVKTRRPSKKGFVKTAEYLTARFQGEGVRYKAKLIGIDTVPEAQGDKMCLDSMMKLKGREVAARNSGQHKQRIWLKVSAAGIQIIDEKSGHAAHTHPNEHISFIKKDETDPRAFAYVFAQDGTYTLLSIKTANSADPVVEDLRDVCQIAAKLNEVNGDDKTTQNADCLLLDEEVTQVQTGIDEIDLFNPLPSSADSDTNKASPSSELSSLFPPSSPFTLPQAQPLPGSPVSPLELYHTGTHQPVWAAQVASSFTHLSQVQPAPFGQPTATAWIQQAPFGTPNPYQLGPWGAQASPTQPAPWGGPGPTSPTQPDPWGATASPTQLIPREASGPLSQPGAVPPVPGVWAQSAPTQPGQRVPGVWGQPGSITPFPASAPPPVPEQGFSPLSSSTETTKSVLWQTSASSSLLEKDPYAALRILSTESSSDI